MADFMRFFGADALFLSPEYLGNVNALSADRRSIHGRIHHELEYNHFHSVQQAFPFSGYNNQALSKILHQQFYPSSLYSCYFIL